MNIDEAIRHCEEVAAKHERQCEFGISKEGKEYNSECAADHRQLAEWLMELKDLRAEQNDQYIFIRELMNELKEAKSIIRVCNRVLGYLLECEIESTSTRHEVETLLKSITEYLSGGSENAE